MRSHKRTARQKNAEDEPAKEEQENMRMNCRGFIIYKTFVLKDHIKNRYKKAKTQRQKDKEGYIMANVSSNWRQSYKRMLSPNGAILFLLISWRLIMERAPTSWKQTTNNGHK